MGVEIERKYLVKSHHWKSGLTEADSSFIQQAYLSADPDRVVRVRIRDIKASITIKNRPTGISRLEFEYPIPLKDAEELIQLCVGSVIVKRRYELHIGKDIWEIDEYLGAHQGLVVAELELRSEDQAIVKPDWLGEEVSGDPQYSNLRLALEAKKR